jgi:tight adherence protein B
MGATVRLIIASAGFAFVAVALWIHPESVRRLRREQYGFKDLSWLRRVLPRTAAPDARVAAITGLAAELRAGRAPERALEAVAQEVWPRTCAVASWGGDVVGALRAEDDRIAAHLAACWQVGTTTGARLAEIIENLARAERDAAEARVELRASLAGPKATARMLAFLPVLGVGLSYLLGADPITWFLGDPLGPPMLIVGALFTGAGVLWTRWITGQVESAL